MEPLWKGVAKRNNLTAQQLGAVEMVALNQFICGLSNSEISQLNTEAFKFVHRTLTCLWCRSCHFLTIFVFEKFVIHN